jgi:hypothetical protein
MNDLNGINVEIKTVYEAYLLWRADLLLIVKQDNDSHKGTYTHPHGLFDSFTLLAREETP